jgi:2-dehydro-3-deoxyphosphogluconate aldolase/(4S)-4-hydroxy-2-oxoglutarate aldolase
VNVIDDIARQRVVPVLRCADADDAVATARAVFSSGLELVELTMTTPGVLQALDVLASDGLKAGVGTIRDAEEVAPAVAAGARFVVSFFNPPGFVEAAAAAGVPAVPGGLTPTELASAQEDGASALKIFPASAVGPEYLALLRPVLRDARFVVSGGIALDEIETWLEGGALAVTIGSAIGTAATVGAAEVERRCRALLR